MHKEHRLLRLTDAQQEAVRKHCDTHPPIFVGKPTTEPPKPALHTRILNRFIDWYSDKI